MLFSLRFHWNVMKTLNHFPLSRLVGSTSILRANFGEYQFTSAGCVALGISSSNHPTTKCDSKNIVPLRDWEAPYRLQTVGPTVSF